MPPSKPADAGPTPIDELERRLDAEVRRRFPGAERVVEHGMPGWRVRRPREVEWTTGTLDPNHLSVFLADRRQGPTVHFWNPFDYEALLHNREALEEAGFKVMVGCVQFTRKRPYPVEAVGALLDQARRQMDAEAKAAKAKPKGPAKRPAKR